MWVVDVIASLDRQLALISMRSTSKNTSAAVAEREGVGARARMGPHDEERGARPWPEFPGLELDGICVPDATID
jgi:hypothetical protein